MLPRYVQAGDFGMRVNMPNQTYTHSTAEYTVEIRTNAQGIRADKDISYENKGRKKRIVVLGDSFGMGYGVELRDSFTEKMKNGLELVIDQEIEVINLSVSGYGTAEQLLMLENEGIKYHPDLVLLTWHATDSMENVRSGIFEMVDGQLQRKNAEFLPGVKIREFLFDFKLYRWLAGNSHLYNWVRREASLVAKKLLVLRKKQTSVETKGVGDTLKPPKDRLSIALLKRIERIAKEVGAPLLLLEIPIRVSRTEFMGSASEYIRTEFDMINPVIEFKKHPNDMIYWEKSHGHFTVIGCEIIGQVLAREIIKLNYPFLNLKEEK